MQTPKKADLDTVIDIIHPQIAHYIERARQAPTRDVMRHAVTLAKQYAEVCEWLADVRGEEYTATSAPHADALDLVVSHLGELGYALYRVEQKTPAQCEERQSLATVRQWLSWMADVAHERRAGLEWIDAAVAKARHKARTDDPKARID